MGLVAQRDLDAVAKGVVGWLASHRGSLEVTSCERPSEGLSSETILCHVRDRDSSTPETIVVRLPPLGDGAFPTYDLAAQAAAQNLTAARGLPVPAPVELVVDEQWLGSPFLVMPAIPGHVPGGVAVHDAWIRESPPNLQRHLYEAFIDQLAAVHEVDVDVATLGIPERGVDAELAYWRRYLDWYADGEVVVPALDDALTWCAEHRPPIDPPPALLWGDVRLGNVIFDESRTPVAILDWEMTTIGAPEHDVAWWRSLEAIQDEFFGRRVDGFPSLDEALRIYEQHLGRPLEHLDWFEVFAMVRSTAIMTRLAVLNERVGNPGLFPIAANPILPLIDRRIEAAS